MNFHEIPVKSFFFWYAVHWNMIFTIECFSKYIHMPIVYTINMTNMFEKRLFWTVLNIWIFWHLILCRQLLYFSTYTFFFFSADRYKYIICVLKSFDEKYISYDFENLWFWNSMTKTCSFKCLFYS